MPSSRESLEFDEAAANTRRLFGSRGGSGRQDVLITEEAVGPSESDEGQGARAAYGKSKKKGAGQKKNDGAPDVARIKCEGAGRH